jgi:hypothetical protein
MQLRLALALALLLPSACASHEDGSRPTSPTKTVETTPEPEPEPQPQPQPQPQPEPEPEPQPSSAKASIASVQMNQDCPDPAPTVAPAAAVPASTRASDEPPPPPAKEMAAKRAARGSSMSGKGPRQRCTQSTMQLAFSVGREAPARVVIERVRMLDAEGSSELATIAARRPMAWVDGTYREWDEAVPAGSEVKASYSLRVPDWTDVETKIGGPSYGHMFVLEVELTIDGEQKTLRSPAFTRERPHVIVT